MSSADVVTPLVTGGETPSVALASQIGTIATRIESIANDMAKAKDEDTARWTALNEERLKESQTLDELKARWETAKRDEETAKALEDVEAMKVAMASMRTPSRVRGSFGGELGIGPAKAGAYIAAIVAASSKDTDAQRIGKAKLAEMGVEWSDVPADSKATLGDTNAAGGWVMPNALVDDLIKPARYNAAVTRIVRTVPGVAVSTIDIPFRTGAPNRAVVAAWGATKENVNLAYDGYTATLYTLARIHDLGKQFVRFSAGAAEADVMGELGDAFARGEAYYILRGSGSSEPYGLQTAIAAAPATFTSAFTPAATLAGSVISAITTAGGALAARDRVGGLSALVSGSSYWLLASQGTDNAGFFLDTDTDPANPIIRVFGVPVYAENLLAATDDLIVGQFDTLKVYHGTTYRVDTSDVAGSRWDNNLIGFRGEMEMGLDARPAVYAGAFQFVADIVP